MSSTTPHPTEVQIQDQFFKKFLAARDSVRVKNWTGWSYKKSRNHREETKFYREFDLAAFYKDAGGLTLRGYEVKGWRKAPTKDMPEKKLEPAFGEGIGQALVLLQQGADFASVIYPEPVNPQDKKALSELCDRYAHNIGIIYVQNDLSSYCDYRPAQQNPYTTTDRKKKMLASLMAGGNFSDIGELPPWAKQQQY